MSDDRSLRTSIQKIAGTFMEDNIYYAYGIVKTINSDETCDVLLNSDKQGNLIPNVKLQAAIGDGFLLIPAIDSDVIVCYSKRNYANPYIVMTSDVSDVYIVSSNKTTMNDGSYGGLVRVTDLVTKLNNLENKVNALVAFSANHFHSGVTTGAGVSGVATVPVTGNLTPTVRADIENTKIIHGI